MRQARIVVAAIVLAAVLGGACGAEEGEGISVLLERGIFEEETAGDIDAAIGIYEGIIETEKARRPYIAEAYLRLGLCYLKQDKPQEARAAFAVVAEKYADVAEVASRARKELAGLLPDEAVPVVLKHDDGTMEDRRSIGASGHFVRLDCPAGEWYLTQVQIYGSRYGAETPPAHDWTITLCDEEFRTIKLIKKPYSIFARGAERWYEVDVPALLLPSGDDEAAERTFWLNVAFNPHQTKGVYLGYDTSGEATFPKMGLPDSPPDDFGEKCNWMIRMVLTRPEPVARTGLGEWVAAPPAPAPVEELDLVELKNDDGKSNGRRSMSGAGPAVSFEGAGENSQLVRLRIYGSRYGSGFDPEKQFVDYYVIDDQGRTIATGRFPYSVFAYKAKWVDVPIKAVNVPASFQVLLNPYAHQKKGVYFHYDTDIKDSHSTYGSIPEDLQELKGKWDWMIRAYVRKGAAQHVSKEASRRSRLLAERGWALWLARQFALAEEKFAEAVEADPGNANALNGLGWSRFNQGLGTEAKESFEKCVAIEPKHAAALNGLGWIAKGRGDTAEAIGWWKKAVAAAPSVTASLSGLAQTYMELENYAMAAGYYSLLLKYDPENAEARAQFMKAAVASRGDVVVEGVGCGAARIGATREDVMRAYGASENTRDDRLDYNGALGFDVYYGTAKGAREIHFNRGFKGKLFSGIGIASSMGEVLEVYGDPVRKMAVQKNEGLFETRVLYQLPTAAKIIYRARGVLFWFDENDRVKQIVIFKAGRR